MLKKRIASIIATGLLLCTLSPIPVSAGTWFKTNDGSHWKYKQDNGKNITMGWLYDNGAWYYFELGEMCTGQLVSPMIGNDPYDYYVGLDGKMVRSGFYDIAKYPGYRAFVDKDGHIIKGLFMVDGVLYDSDDRDGAINKNYVGESSINSIMYNGGLYPIWLDNGKVLDKDTKQPLDNDDYLFKSASYIPKYDSMGNLVGEIRN